jgi:hypothetical protein
MEGQQRRQGKDDKGVEMNVDPAMIEKVRREGINWLSPQILRITPVVSVWPLLGMKEPDLKLAGV